MWCVVCGAWSVVRGACERGVSFEWTRRSGYLNRINSWLSKNLQFQNFWLTLFSNCNGSWASTIDGLDGLEFVTFLSNDNFT